MENWQLKQLQELPLGIKIEKSKLRIREWYEHHQGEVYVSFSGGKDSTVLLHLVRSIYSEVPAMFVDTGLEYPSIKEFVRNTENVEIVRPIMNFREVLQKHGYPVVSKKTARMIKDIQNPTEKNQATRTLYLTGVKRDGTITKSFKLPDKWHYLINAPFKISHKCCDIMKKEPIKRYEKETKRKAYVGVMASDSDQRKNSYLLTGCNSFKTGKSQPLGFWKEEDIWEYLKQNNVPYCSVYDKGESRTGCIFCGFGCHLEDPENNRFTRLQKNYPKVWNYCIKDLGMGEVLDYMGINYHSQMSIEDLID